MHNHGSQMDSTLSRSMACEMRPTCQDAAAGSHSIAALV